MLVYTLLMRKKITAGRPLKDGEKRMLEFEQHLIQHIDNSPLVLDARSVYRMAQIFGLTLKQRAVCDFLKRRGWIWKKEWGYVKS